MIVIPAIDLYGGRAVRLTRGDYSARKNYSSSPVSVAAEFYRLGFSIVHVVDLEGAKQGNIVNLETIESIAALADGKVQVGGGIRTTTDIESLLNLGVHRIITGSIAVSSPELAASWLREFGPEKIVIGLDVKRDRIAYDGWLHTSDSPVADFILRMLEYGARIFICTDILKDGMLEGPNADWYRRLVIDFPDAEFIASGGVSSADDLRALEDTGVSGVIVGKAIYEGKISHEDLKSYIA
jgi:phosphoribosylformimino-5-aminoimidazole carboxamide ribotide isomerase